MFGFKNNNNDDDYIDKIIDLNKPEAPAIYDEHPPLFEDPYVKLVGGIWLALAIIAVLVIFFAPIPGFFNSNSKFDTEVLDGDIALKQAQNEPIIKNYILENISYSGDHLTDYFGLLTNTSDYLRLDYDCRLLTKYMVREVKRSYSHTRQNKEYYREKVQNRPCPGNSKDRTPDSNIYIGDEVFRLTPSNYYTNGMGNTYPLRAYRDLSSDIFNNNRYEDNHLAAINGNEREIYTIMGVPANSKVSFYASVGNGHIKPLHTGEDTRNKYTYIFGGSIRDVWREPPFSRVMVLTSIELSLFLILILVIWYHRSEEIF